MYMDQALLVHQAELRRYRPGQEETTLRVVSSASSDAGTCVVLQESQEDPTVYQIQAAGARAWLRAAAMRRLTSVFFRAVGREPSTTWPKCLGGSLGAPLVGALAHDAKGTHQGCPYQSNAATGAVSSSIAQDPERFYRGGEGGDAGNGQKC